MRNGTTPVRAAVTVAAVVVALLLGACNGTANGNRPGPGPGSASQPAGSTDASSSPGSSPSRAGSGTLEPLGAKYDWSRFDLVSPYLKNLSGSATFYELVWCDIEPADGHQDWTTMDAVARKAQTVGARLMIKIRVGSCWATGQRKAQHVRGAKRKTESFLPTDLNRYRAFVASVVKRYSATGVHTYAVENEPNSESFWGGSTSELETLVKAAADSIRAADPAAAVADPGISSTAYGAAIAKRLLDEGKTDDAVTAWNTYYARRIGTRGDQIAAVHDAAGLRAALASPQAARNLQYLALAESLQKDKVVDIRQVHFYESWDAAPAFVDYLKATTPAGMPIEAWEVGQFLKDGSLTEDQRAQEMVKTVSILLAGGIRRVLWLPLVMNPTGRNSEEPRYGLLDPDGSTRLTGTAFETMARASAGATASPISGKGLSGVALEKNGRTTAFVWSAGGDVRISLLPGESVRQVGAQGGPAPGGSAVIASAPTQIDSNRSASELVGAL
ncbi:hypothetical protein [Terrabacter sp. BE26]|uniref:hypothetical protein n=1 Tax=Terrabacter sp. BE26 TaxID=2898152 RepID=UPI0035BE4EF9